MGMQGAQNKKGHHSIRPFQRRFLCCEFEHDEPTSVIDEISHDYNLRCSPVNSAAGRLRHSYLTMRPRHPHQYRMSPVTAVSHAWAVFEHQAWIPSLSSRTQICSPTHMGQSSPRRCSHWRPLSVSRYFCRRQSPHPPVAVSSRTPP